MHKTYYSPDPPSPSSRLPPRLRRSPQPFSGMSLPIAAFAVVGILTTSLFLFTYYVFVINCCLNWRRSASRRPFPSPAQSNGLDLSAIRAIPTVRYSSLSPAAECAVCLSEFGEGERLRRLPVCSHAFHIDCVDTWLQSNTTCPLCRAHIRGPFPPPGADDADAEACHVDPRNPRRILAHALSMDGERVVARRAKEELEIAVQSLRRSLSMDSSGRRRLHVSVQEMLRRNPGLVCDEETGNGGGGGEDGGSGRVRRPFFPAGYGRSSWSAIQRVGMDV